MANTGERFRLGVLVSVVAISGFSQGMLLPLIALLFEQEGMPASLNGLNATGLYIGILLISPFMEKPLRQFGYKPVIIGGGLLVIAALFAFPLWKSFWFWFILRLLIGIGDHALHFGTQTWITTFSSPERRGRNISLYGLFFGLGFAAGPLMTGLIHYGEALPFILSAVLCLVCWVFLFFLKNDFPEQQVETNSMWETMKRFREAFRYGWLAFLPTFAYGFLETSFNGIYPIYGVRTGLSVQEISIILMSFAIGGIVFQFPLGMMSDKYGRKRILSIVLLSGTLLFFSAALIDQMYPLLLMCIFLAGMLVGSTFSLGISFMTDLMPRPLLPTGNLLCGMAFSIGSLTGPYLGGLALQLFQAVSFFAVISSIFGLVTIIFFLYGGKPLKKEKMLPLS
ncbi:MFS transporter [Pseudobacillus badius]|uniref:MFS transporter n=1 Tax=Bacillus badius TaxID=1455 RepID=UPI0007B0394D|nr:MFS transporter [Bacillus badius]KZO01747.1 MFS transporter [Bacillus badius]OCS90140.1 MFS transporter [Bacillus badius]OVE53668.1 MFS transporter [Bacillus badius]TDW06039.1 putative MFS family arabinose efflux permease [Bacillus badius]GLY10401.1 putative MFS-type transporter YfkF [Bacillus badius]